MSWTCTTHGQKVYPLTVPENGWIIVRDERGIERKLRVLELQAETEAEALFLAGKTRILQIALSL